MAIKQISVFAENKPGALLEITGALSAKNIDMRAICVADTQDYGIVRLIVTDIEGAKEALKSDHLITTVSDVIAVMMPDKPGALQKAIKCLYEGNVNVEYLYAFITTTGKEACLVIRVGDNEAAEDILTAGGFTVISEEMLRSL